MDLRRKENISIQRDMHDQENISIQRDDQENDETCAFWSGKQYNFSIAMFILRHPANLGDLDIVWKF